MITMDAHELSALLHMQNQTQYLLEKLQANQSHCRQLLDTSLSSISSSGVSYSRDRKQEPPHSDNARLSSNQVIKEAAPDKGSQQSRTALASRSKKQKLLSQLQAKSKLENYRKVSSGEKPGKPSGSRLKQGLENNRFLFGDCSLHAEGLAVDGSSSREEGAAEHKNDSYKFIVEKDDSAEHERANTSVTFQDELELLGSGNGSMSSTPKRNDKSLSETPRSILKHRKIINDNVRVDSEYGHTPINLMTPKCKDSLNYSYSSIDDGIIGSPKMTGCDGNSSSYCDSINGSYIEECLSRGHSLSKRTSDPLTKEDDREELSEVEKLIKERLLLDEGNDRKNASIVRDLSKRPKSYVFQSSADLDDTQTKQIAPVKKRTPIKPPKSPNASSKSKPPQRKSASQNLADSEASKLWRSRDQPLLGYDWIASNLENEGSLFDQPDEYFREIQEFRNKHKLSCAGKSFMSKNLDLSRPISPEVTDPGHKCLHGYTVNERLFTEPMNANDEGKSVCPVCLTSREEPSEQSPGFIRVSIPRSTLEKPYKIKAHRRRSFDATDSCALSQHCLAGYECSLPTTIPTAKNIDIRGANGIQGKQAMTLHEAEDFVRSHSRKSRLMATQPSKVIADHNRTTSSLISGLNLASDSLNRGPDVSSKSMTRDHHTTNSLLNISHSLRYDLQDLARRTGRDKHKIPHSTNFPVL